jgi:hypothetical protein
MWEDWDKTSSASVGWSEKFEEIKLTRYGARKIREKNTNQNLLNAKLADGLRKFIPEVGKFHSSYITSAICENNRKVRKPGQAANIDGAMATSLGVKRKTIGQSVRRRRDEIKGTGKDASMLETKDAGQDARSGTADDEHKLKKKPKAEISMRRNYPTQVLKKKWNDHEQRGHLAFFDRIAHILSGTGVDSNRRHIGMPQHEVKIELYAETPQILCRIYDNAPFITQKRNKKGNFTRFQASMLAAVYQRNQAGFDAEEDYNRRKIVAQQAQEEVVKNLQRYRSSKAVDVRARAISALNAVTTQDPILGTTSTEEHIANDSDPHIDRKTIEKVEAILQDETYRSHKANMKANDADNKRRAKRSADKKPDKAQRMYATFDPSKYEIRVRTMNSFFSMIKAKGIKYTYNVHRHPCPVHEEGPIWVHKLRKYELELSELDKVTNSCSYTQKKAQLRFARWKVHFYNVHKEQYKLCRPYTQYIQKRMKPGQCMVFRDFVNQHNEENDKVCNLVLVVLWRDVEDGVLSMIKISNICTDKDSQMTDAAFVADVMNNHFTKGRNSFFDRFTHVYLVGDHGSHFSCKQTFYEESQFV